MCAKCVHLKNTSMLKKNFICKNIEDVAAHRQGQSLLVMVRLKRTETITYRLLQSRSDRNRVSHNNIELFELLLLLVFGSR